MNWLKILAAFFVCIVILNLVLFVLHKISSFVFWMVIIFMAFAAYYLIPYLSKNGFSHKFKK